ncbi:MAG: hypothetical protein M3259_05845 [Actinomycetota bacterium]|nr:hypothetical protein [Actinomycetota bacterium]
MSPSVFDERIVPALAEAVEAAARTRAERKDPEEAPPLPYSGSHNE